MTYRTGFAIGPALELPYALAQTESGQWIASVHPGMLLTTTGEQSTVFIPVVASYRWF